MISGFRHVGITVQDLEKAQEFYEMLGFKLERKMEESGTFIDRMHDLQDCSITTVKMKGPDDVLIELLKFHKHKMKNDDWWTKPIYTSGLTHIALTVDDVERLFTNSQDMDLQCIGPPQVSPDGFAKVMFCRGFEGIFLELVEILKR